MLITDEVVRLGQPVTTFELGGYFIDLVKIEHFRSYYESNISSFSKVSRDSFLKTLDIPPKFFKEQPAETQEELLDNREVFVKENKKYLDKVIVVARCKLDSAIINCSRMSEQDALKSYEQLKTIDEIPNTFEHRSFIKDSYITYIVSDKIENKKENKVLVIDFPITLNKPAVIHEAYYTLPDETFATPVEHIQYLTSTDINFETEYKDIKEAINDNISFLSADIETAEAKNILREPEVVALALNVAKVFPQSYIHKVGNYIKENAKGILNTHQLEKLVLDYDETFRAYKQVRAIREIDGFKILKVLESSKFKELIDGMENIEEELEI